MLISPTIPTLRTSDIEEKLTELIGDPDEGLPIRKSLRDRLLRQKALVDRGDYGLPFEKALKEAVRNVIKDHKRTGDPILIWRNGKIAKISPNHL